MTIFAFQQRRSFCQFVLKNVCCLAWWWIAIAHANAEASSLSGKLCMCVYWYIHFAKKTCLVPFCDHQVLLSTLVLLVGYTVKLANYHLIHNTTLLHGSNNNKFRGIVVGKTLKLPVHQLFDCWWCILDAAFCTITSMRSFVLNV